MSAARTRLPRRFPAGAKLVVEGEDAAGGGVRIVKRYLVYPDGRRINLLAGAPRVVECCDTRAAGTTRQRRVAPGGGENLAVLQ
jgi:hypothetical protein